MGKGGSCCSSARYWSLPLAQRWYFATSRLSWVGTSPVGTLPRRRHIAEEIEQRGQTPLLAVEFVFRAQASLIVLWALGGDHARRVIERAHERAIVTVLRWLEDEVAETRWSSGRQRAKVPCPGRYDVPSLRQP